MCYARCFLRSRRDTENHCVVVGAAGIEGEMDDVEDVEDVAANNKGNMDIVDAEDDNEALISSISSQVARIFTNIVRDAVSGRKIWDLVLCCCGSPFRDAIVIQLKKGTVF